MVEYLFVATFAGGVLVLAVTLVALGAVVAITCVRDLRERWMISQSIVGLFISAGLIAMGAAWTCLLITGFFETSRLS